MPHVVTLTLYGANTSREHAKRILENHSAIRRIDVTDNSSTLMLLLTKKVSEEELIALLSHSGLLGLRIAYDS